MKNWFALMSLIFLLSNLYLTGGVLAQDNKKEYYPEKSTRIQYEDDKFILNVEVVLKDKFNVKGDASGPGLYQYSGYSLYETLIHMGRVFGLPIQIESLYINPRIWIKFQKKNGKLVPEDLEKILSVISNEFSFSHYKGKGKRNVVNLEVEDPVKLQKFKVQNLKLEPGVEYKSRIKNNTAIYEGITLDRLANELTSFFGEVVFNHSKVETSNDRYVIEVDRSNEHSIISSLSTYGIIVRKIEVERNIIFISSESKN